MTKWNYIVGSALVAMAVSSTAKADDEVKTGWRLQGPAASYHFSKYGAPVTGPTTEQVNDGSNIVNQTNKWANTTYYSDEPAYPGETAAAYCNGVYDTSAIAATLGHEALSKSLAAYQEQCRKNLYRPHAVSIAAPTRSYNGNNYGLGLEYTRRTTDSVGRYFGGVVKDSYSNPSIYLGSAFQWTVSDRSRFRTDAGFITMFWLRSIADSNGMARRKLILAALPVVSVEDKQSGIGVNMTWIPKISWKGEQRTVNTVTIQVSYKLK